MTSQLKQLLLIDDELLLTASVRRLVRGMREITAFGLSNEIAVANTGRQVITYVSQAPARTIGLAILDASLPDVYGVDLLHTLVQRNYPSLHGCLFVMWSSWECQDEARTQGAHGYISKVRNERYAFNEDLLTMLRALITEQRTWYELGPFG